MEEKEKNENQDTEEKKEEEKEEKEEERTEKTKEELREINMHLATANKYYYGEEFENALEEYDAALGREDVQENLDAFLKAMYWKGETLAKLKKYEDAVEIFHTLSEKGERHNLAYSAKRRIEHIKELMEMEAEASEIPE
jgi:tetratricopeptide (TPR) repeat protein